MSLADFKTLVNGHLDNTDWKYEVNQDCGAGLGLANHPIRVIGPTRVEANGLGGL